VSIPYTGVIAVKQGDAEWTKEAMSRVWTDETLGGYHGLSYAAAPLPPHRGASGYRNSYRETVISIQKWLQESYSYRLRVLYTRACGVC